MPLNIKDPATEKSVRELAALTGETVTTAVRRAAEGPHWATGFIFIDRKIL
jgi:hypothetical protein